MHISVCTKEQHKVYTLKSGTLQAATPFVLALECQRPSLECLWSATTTKNRFKRRQKISFKIGEIVIFEDPIHLFCIALLYKML